MNNQMAFLEIPFILEQLNLLDARNNNNNNNTTGGFNTTGTEGETSDDDRNSISRRSIDDRALAPRISSLENSLVEHINTSVPSLDELVIRQRGRKKQPAKISWSPIKSPFKTPTKRNNSALHMSLLSPSPAKKLFANTSMTLRSSPRKRILVDTPTEVHDPASCSTPVSSPTKRLKLFDERPMNATNPDVPIKTLLKGLNHEQLMMIICDMSSKDPTFEQGVRMSLPSPNIRSFEEQLCSLRKNITKSSPRSRLLSRTDGPAFARASPHLIAFKK
jgi:Cut8, nuclear proteasome tether protein